MCPDDKLLSAYFDGEVMSPWKERMASHVESCAACSAKIEKMRAVSLFLDSAGDSAEKLREAKERVWARLSVSTKPGPVNSSEMDFGKEKFWARRIALPLPILAAAAAALIVASGLAAGMLQMGGSRSNLASVKKYLENQSSSQALMINLPNVSNYSGQNDPVLMIKTDSSDLNPFANDNGGVTR